MAEETHEQKSSAQTLDNQETPQVQAKQPVNDSKVKTSEEKLQEAVEAKAKKVLNRKEEIIWRGTPRHILMFKYHAISLIMIGAFSYLGLNISVYFFALLVIPVVLSGIKILEVKTNIYEISNKRLKMKKGIFSSVTNEIELYHIKNTVLEEKRNNKGFITFYTTNEKFDKIKFPRMNNPSKIHSKVRDIYEEIKLERNKITHTKK